MRKLLLALSVASLFAAPVMAEGDALNVPDPHDPAVVASTVSSTNVKFEGTIVAPTCSIVADDQNQVIVLDTLLTTDVAAGVTSKKDFKIGLERCPTVNKFVSLHLDVPQDKLDGQFLKNTFGGFKADVSLKISHNGSPVNLAAAAGEQGITKHQLATNAPSDYVFSVEYVKATNAGDTINPGLVRATLPVEVIYK